MCHVMYVHSRAFSSLPPLLVKSSLLLREKYKGMEDFVGGQKKHFVLIHGACHGAWCWYKVKPQLESSGHRVTVLDLAGAGINAKSIEEVYSFSGYTQPLLDFLISSVQPNEKVILVGHSLGGMSLSLAMEKFPEKIEVAVFLTAFMPDTKNQPSYVLEEYGRRVPEGGWLDTKFAPYGNSELQLQSMLFGTEFLSLKLYQLSPVEDLELAKSLMRPSSLFVHDLSKSKKLTEEGYGSVKRVFVVCSEDKGITEEFQRWMIENSPVDEIMEMKETDHMAMLSQPQELTLCLLKIAQKPAK
ncbi:hypothetical protein K2173_006030 [Erythroxylum novogranatense]|uniref:(S)-hydroxynitrile lyase n=1 Tax=Erythroxylum novogranatense TaxID=1862640 RepID=A0AAV8TC19_9ROSI|nr:hypothetical protein K2173_006030 [Erythroxylum novogranatense]